MSMRSFDRPTDGGRWHRAQTTELVNGTIGLAVCFALVCLFLIAMAR